MMTSQKVTFEERRLNYKFDNYLFRADKMVPYDRIQDVNITDNCVQRCFGVHSVSIQTAGGGQVPELMIIAPKNPGQLRDQIIAHRDGIVHGTSSGAPPQSSRRDDGTGTTQLTTSTSTTSPLIHAGQSSQELAEINRTLQRIEKLMESGLNKMEVK